MSHKKIVFFDGVCNLCNGFVDFLMQHEKKHELCMSSLQGSTAEKLVPHEWRSGLESVVYFNNGTFYRKSEAVAQVLTELPLPWPILGRLMLLIPNRVRDIIYDWVAENRYMYFGKRESCRIPTADERRRLLD